MIVGSKSSDLLEQVTVIWVQLTLSVKQSIIDPVTMTKFHLDAGVSGFYLCGSTGEGLNASTSERKVITESNFLKYSLSF